MEEHHTALNKKCVKTGDFFQGKCAIITTVHPKTKIAYCLLSMWLKTCITEEEHKCFNLLLQMLHQV